MSIPSQTAARCCRRALRQSSPSFRLSQSSHISQPRRNAPIVSVAKRWESTESAPAPPENPKISQIVDQISQLTLLETADLVSTLKVGVGLFLFILSVYIACCAWAE